MENHPIPQDVTGFKFKLIGSITVRQFLYLLGGGIIVSVILFALPFNLFLKIPFAMFFGFISFALAFLPIDGRPLDRMMFNFIRVLPAENMYLYHRKGVNIAAFEFFNPPPVHQQVQQKVKTPAENQEVKRNLLMSRLRNSYRPDEGEMQFFNSLKGYFDDGTPVTTPVAVSAIATQSTPQIKPEESKPRSVIHRPTSADIAESKKKEEQEETIAHQQPVATPPQTVSVPAANVPQQPAPQQAPVAQPPPIQQPVAAATQQPQTSNENVKVIEKEQRVNAGFPILPDIPNVLLGIVVDPRGKVLPNVLVEVFDTNQTPVRTFKTNKLGQFAAATPLQNGTYKVYFEDPMKQHEFDTIEIVMNGTIFSPLEVTSVDQREKLRRELFEN